MAKFWLVHWYDDADGDDDPFAFVLHRLHRVLLDWVIASSGSDGTSADDESGEETADNCTFFRLLPLASEVESMWH